MTVFEFEGFSFSRVEGLRRGSTQIPIGPGGRLLLDHLLRTRGRPTPSDELTRLLWEAFGSKSTASNALANEIYKLRQALGDTKKPWRFIDNYPGRGYEFIAPVDEVASARTGDASGAQSAAAVEVATPDDDHDGLAGEPPSRRAAIFTLPLGIVAYEAVALVTEVAQAWDVLGKRAVEFAAISAAPLYAMCVASLMLQARLFRRGFRQASLFVGTLLTLSSVVMFWAATLPLLPWESTVFAIFGTMVAPTGFFKSGAIYGVVLCVGFVVVPLQNVLMIDARYPTPFLSPKVLAAVALLLFFISGAGSLLLVTALRPTSYAGLFSLLVLVRFVVFWIVACGAILWYANAAATRHTQSAGRPKLSASGISPPG
jgi:DNA-binding winged helix-turn-helix (wHTH) protein